MMNKIHKAILKHSDGKWSKFKKETVEALFPDEDQKLDFGFRQIHIDTSLSAAEIEDYLEKEVGVRPKVVKHSDINVEITFATKK